MSHKLDHVGVVVKNAEETAALYKKILGLIPWKMGAIEDAKNGVRLLSLPIGDTFIELVQPTRPGNRFARFLEERGGGLFHLCIFTDDYDKEVSALKKNGVKVEEEMANSIPGQPFRLAWLPPESTQGLWIELVDISAVPDDLRHHKF